MTSIPPMQFIDWWMAKSEEQRITFLADEQTSENVKRNLRALESYCRHYAYKVYCATQIRPRVLPIRLDSFNIIDNKEEELMTLHKKDEEQSLLYSPLLLSLYSNNTTNKGSTNNVKEEENKFQLEEKETAERSNSVSVALHEEHNILKHRKMVVARVEHFLHDTLAAIFHKETENVKSREDNTLEQQLLELFAQLVVTLLSETTIAAAYRTGLADNLYTEHKELAIKQKERETAKRQSRILRLSFVQKAELERRTTQTENKTLRNAKYLESQHEQEEELLETSLAKNEEVHNEFTLHKSIEAYCREMKALCGLQQLLGPMMSLLSLSEFSKESEPSSSSQTNKRKREIDEAEKNTSWIKYKRETNAMSSWAKLRLTCANGCNLYLGQCANENKTLNSEERNISTDSINSNSKNVHQKESNVKASQTTDKEKLTLTERDVRFAIQHLMCGQEFLDLSATIAALV